MSATVYYLQSSILSSASYVERRSQPSTWWPRQKLAEERISSVTTKIEKKIWARNVTRIETNSSDEL